jgi:Na+-translocating ferredoxin:NAD+ oxidoreductase RnfD subunit
MNLPVALALVVILAGAAWVLRPLQMLPMVAAFLVTFAILIAAIAASGGCFLATWHAGPICGSAYWFNICTSPELLVFVFFMISDPRTAPRPPLARAVYGVTIALLAAALILPQPSEYGIKVALLASLTVVCSFVPLLERFAAPARPGVQPRVAAAPGLLSLFAAVAITLGVPSATVALASNQQVVDIDSGINTPGTPIQ